VNRPVQELTVATRGSRGFFEAPFVHPVQSESVSDTKVQSPRTLNFDLICSLFRQGAYTAGLVVREMPMASAGLIQVLRD
jgi:hypothetical protein